MYKFLDYEGLGYLIDEIKRLFVQKEGTKGLSTNDFTNILKQKLDGVASGAQVNTVDSVNGKVGQVVITSDDIDFLSSVSGSTAKTVRATIDEIIAKDKVQDTTIGKKADKTTVYTKEEVDSRLTAQSGDIDKKADKATTYTRTVIDGKFTAQDLVNDKKADKASVYTTTQIDGKLATQNTLIGTKADQKTTYTKVDVDGKLATQNTLIGTKADKSTTYTKADIDGKLTTQDTAIDKKADKATTYTRLEIDAKNTAQNTEIDKKADKATTYSKTEVDGKLGAIDSGVITVNKKSGNVVLTGDDLAIDVDRPQTLAEALDVLSSRLDGVDTSIQGLESNKASITYVDGKLTGKVDKVAGKGLSTEDFTEAAKGKLDGIEAGAKQNIIEIIKRNGTNITVSGKAVDITVPTKLSDLTNDKTFQTETQIRSLIQDVGRLKKQVVESLPTVALADDNTIYLVPSDGGVGFSEWMVVNAEWEKLGDTAAIDFTPYVKHTEIKTVSNAEIDALLNV